MIDAVVIGAGVAGLLVARRLQAAGLAVAVVEARERLGGRTWSPLIGGVNLDLGATWVWDSETAVHALIEELGLVTFPSGHAGADLYNDGPTIERFRRPSSAIKEQRIHGGTQAICNALATDTKSLTLGRAARAIEPAAGGVRVLFDDCEQLARHVVLAIPPALLGHQIELPSVDPELLALLAQTPTWMADVAKVVALFSNAFWCADGLSGEAFSRVGPMAEIHDLSGPPSSGHAALFGFVPMVNAIDDWKGRAQAQFVRLFGPQAASPVAFRAQPWWAERGTAPSRPGRSQPSLFGSSLLRRPLLDGRVFLASTETSAVSTGHIDGAVRRGEQVARAILEQRAERAR